MVEAGVISPCTGVCRIDERSGLCQGCLRTIDEIAAWSTLSNAARWQVVKLLAKRRDEKRQAGSDGPP